MRYTLLFALCGALLGAWTIFYSDFHDDWRAWMYLGPGVIIGGGIGFAIGGWVDRRR
jgi:uncharacterized membrane protein YfcA